MVDKIKSFIIKKMFYHNYIGGKHTAVENLSKGLPGHFKGDIKKAIYKLIKNKIIIPKRTFYGLQVSLNPGKREEIQNYIK